MQIKLFTIPILGGETLNEELNRFLRSKKVLQVESHMVEQTHGAFWCFSVRYLDQQSGFGKRKEKVDYKEVLDTASFGRFSKFREIRKQIAKEEDIPAFAVFSDAELAGLAKVKNLTLSNMKSVKGVGEKKVEKYGQRFIQTSLDEKSE